MVSAQGEATSDSVSHCEQLMGVVSADVCYSQMGQVD